MNATIQMLRAIPELRTVLTGCVCFDRILKLAHQAFHSGSTSGLPAHLGNLYTSMSRTTDTFVPHQFLSSLRQNFPQFAEVTRGDSGTKQIVGPVFAQQGHSHFWRPLNVPSWATLKHFFLDAEECFSQIVGTALRDVPGPSGGKFVEAYMMSRVRTVCVFAAFLLPRRTFNTDTT